MAGWMGVVEVESLVEVLSVEVALVVVMEMATEANLVGEVG